MINHSQFAERVKSGETLIGSLHDLEDPHLVELVAGCGVDFVVFCFEHGLKSEGRLAELIRAADAAGIPAMVRIGRREESSVERFLDAGAAGLIVAHIDSKSRAEQVVGWCNYPPLGERGAGFARAQLSRACEVEYERKMQANDDLVLIGIIEDPAGVENIDEIVQVPGFTGFMAGPGDLALAMGEKTHEAPAVVKAVEHVNTVVGNAPAPVLMGFCKSPSRAKALTDVGTSLLLFDHDYYIIKGAYQEFVDQVRANIVTSTAG